MPRNGLIYFSLAFIVSLAAILVSGCASAPDAGAAPASAFEGYTSWTKVNRQPITGDTTGALGSAHQGERGFREVYINDVGKGVSSGGASYPYPQGTVVVKESYKRGSSGGKGDLAALTVMVKREAGYDPENGDWEYAMATPAMKIQAQGKLGMCINCHAAAFDDDYVFTHSR